MTECERIIEEGILPKEFFQEEIRNDFLVDVERKKIWAVELDLLLKFDAVCKKHNLTYFLAFGSLLGAVRHNGFIPWDDDMDVCMPREDYEKFLSLGDEFKFPYFLQTPYSDPGFFYAHAKIRNSNTTFADAPFLFQGFNLGVFIDVLPIDKIDEQNGKVIFDEISKLIIDNSTYMRLTNPNLSEKDKKRVAEYSGDNPLQTYEKINKLARSWENKTTNFLSLCVAVTYGFERDVFQKEDFSSCRFVKFENLSVPIPIGYDRILRIIYGNYMVFPTTEKRGVWHSSVKYYPDIPYVDYLRQITLLNKTSEGDFIERR